MPRSSTALRSLSTEISERRRPCGLSASGQGSRSDLCFLCRASSPDTVYPLPCQPPLRETMPVAAGYVQTRSQRNIPMPLNTLAARRDQAFHVHPSTNLRVVQREGPLVITRGDGVYVYDDEGRRYIEGMAGLWCASLGFSERRLADAAYRQMCELPFYHSFGGKVPAISTELAERLIRMAPTGMGKVLFANSGSEANDTAIKLAWYVNNALGRPQKKKIISRQRAYHGVTVATASLTGLAFAHEDFDLPIARILHTDCPHYYRGAPPGGGEEAF